jgi:hypothetical protein
VQENVPENFQGSSLVGPDGKAIEVPGIEIE